MASRTEQLSQPKPNLLRHVDRRSVYWRDELPPKRTGCSTSFELTPRWSQLSRSKTTQPGFDHIRDSPIWVVSKGALHAHASHRLCALALPRCPAAGWQPDRPILASVSSTKALLKTKQAPKHEHPMYSRERPMSWHIPRAARNAVASKRVVELSCPKERKALFEGYNPYIVSQAARSAQPSPRLQELCLPLPRKCKLK
ncbi:sperm microtubule associated protein 2 [Lampris incognitus]|uniref:sperm microtubule associated protein 2 n=1 Tax=Lampris incognitus TaxID=2546036 RepID=UPI0024B52D23|nr:sperm microtubule associated protein 2 [Lampris incognitus]